MLLFGVEKKVEFSGVYSLLSAHTRLQLDVREMISFESNSTDPVSGKIPKPSNSCEWNVLASP